MWGTCDIGFAIDCRTGTVAKSSPANVTCSAAVCTNNECCEGNKILNIKINKILPNLRFSNSHF